MKTQIPSITPLRGIAAIIVAIHHFQFRISDFELTQKTWFFYNGFLWIDFFFILSGFVIAHVYLQNFISGTNWKNYKIFIFSRIARIYPLHIFIIFGLVILEFIKMGIVSYGGINITEEPFSGERGIWPLFSSIFLLQNWFFQDLAAWNPVSWSISMEFFLYIIFPFALMRLYKGNLLSLACKAFFLILVIWAQTVIAPPGSSGYYHLRSVKNIAEFFIGILAYRLYAENVWKNLFHKDGFFLLCLSLSVACIHLNFNYSLVIPCFALLVIAGAANDRVSSNILNTEPLNHLGNISYSVYMLHYPIIMLAQKSTKVFFGSNLNTYLSNNLLLTPPAQVFIYLLIVIMAASISYKKIEVPFREGLKKTRFFRNMSLDISSAAHTKGEMK
ncbi:MAG: acyltransferase [Nitrospina sp.]|jgi:peptidoglycan/LPS O-acetylase OafA/YrhL|nr:acyltransferase [Nitrospina sp.]MBT3855457.1 acyltransferase [Nitrospina sp.]MBT4105239.1 acyltransferase [Nitrospina sp.]MBT4390340.1 acyltransferase [Nitrospina sp.]MBT4622139.1 acyltransferase [Nitrospina sp.]